MCLVTKRRMMRRKKRESRRRSSQRRGSRRKKTTTKEGKTARQGHDSHPKKQTNPTTNGPKFQFKNTQKNTTPPTTPHKTHEIQSNLFDINSKHPSNNWQIPIKYSTNRQILDKSANSGRFRQIPADSGR